MDGSRMHEGLGWLAAEHLQADALTTDLWPHTLGRCQAAVFSPLAYQLELWFSAWRW